jgi:hypothetical protein
MTGGKAGSMSGNQLAGMRSALGLDESEMAIVAGRGVELWRKLEARGDLAAGDTADDAFLRVLGAGHVRRSSGGPMLPAQLGTRPKGFACLNSSRFPWSVAASSPKGGTATN